MFLMQLFFGVMFCLVTVHAQPPFSETPPLVGLSSVEQVASLPIGLCDYWVEFMHRCELNQAFADDWYQVSHEQLVDRFTVSEQLVAASSLYCPAGELVDKHPLVFWVVHGTWAEDSDDYYNHKNGTFQDILGFARDLADRSRRPIEVVSYVWSGIDSHDDRRKAGGDLRILGECFFSAANGYGSQWAFGHSHGVNVILLASQELYFECIISLGAPVIEHLYAPIHVGALYHFYSLGDPWQKAGAVEMRSLKSFITSLGGGERAYSRQPGIYECYNFRVMFDAVDPGHVSVKLVIPYLWQVLDVVKEQYRYHSHFNLNVAKMFEARDTIIQLSIRDHLELIQAFEMMSEHEVSPEKIAEFRKELVYSKQQEEQFAWRYRGKHMNSSGVGWRKILSNWLELSELIQAKIPFLRFRQYKDFSLLKEPALGRPFAQ